MSTEQENINSNAGIGPLFELSIEEIRLPDISNVRPFSSKLESSEKDISETQRLMLSIEQEGQIQPVVVQPIKDAKPEDLVKYDLIAGRRRYRAVAMHNMASDKPLKLKAVIGDDVKAVSQLFRRAAHENIMREAITAIDFAYNIQKVRENKKWKTAKDTGKVAEFFGVSEAQITQHEKLLGLDEMFQIAIAEGRLTREGAYALLKVKKDQRQNVFDAAVKAQKAELGEGAIGAAQSDLDPKPATKKGKTSGAAKQGGVKAKHVKKAARAADPDTVQSRSKKEIVEYFEGQMGPAYGYADGAVHQFCGNFIKWVKGEIQDRTLDKYWDALVEKAPRGTMPKKEETAPKPKK